MSETQIYDYHPPLPAPDTEASEASLGDCAICMDAIHPNQHAQTTLVEEEKGLLSGVSSNSSIAGSSSGLAGLWNVVNGRARERAHAVAMRGRGRKNYSLAPCHHLFVSPSVSACCDGSFATPVLSTDRCLYLWRV